MFEAESWKGFKDVYGQEQTANKRKGVKKYMAIIGYLFNSSIQKEV